MLLYTQMRKRTYILEAVLIVIIILERLEIIVVLVKALELECTAGKPVNRTGDDLHTHHEA